MDSLFFIMLYTLLFVPGCFLIWRVLRGHGHRWAIVSGIIVCLIPSFLVAASTSSYIEKPHMGLSLLFSSFSLSVLLGALLSIGGLLALIITIRLKKGPNETVSINQIIGNIFSCSFLALALILAAVTSNIAFVHEVVSFDMSNDTKEIEELTSRLVKQKCSTDEKVTYKVGMSGDGPLYNTVSVPERIESLAKDLSLLMGGQHWRYHKSVFDKHILYLTGIASLLCAGLASLGSLRWLGVLALPVIIYSLLTAYIGFVY